MRRMTVGYLCRLEAIGAAGLGGIAKRSEYAVGGREGC